MQPREGGSPAPALPGKEHHGMELGQSSPNLPRKRSSSLLAVPMGPGLHWVTLIPLGPCPDADPAVSSLTYCNGARAGHAPDALPWGNGAASAPAAVPEEAGTSPSPGSTSPHQVY